MPPLRSVLLLHTRRQDTHVDWLLENPHDPRGPLIAYRLPATLRHGLREGAWTITPLPPHRRRYLTYQGPIAEGRGWVVQLAGSDGTATSWRDSRRRWRSREFDLSLSQLTPERWRLVVRHRLPDANEPE